MKIIHNNNLYIKIITYIMVILYNVMIKWVIIKKKNFLMMIFIVDAW